eukprot:10892121-Karenia_brevis.AAC.1
MHLNSNRFTTYEDTIAEISTSIEARTGTGILHSRTDRGRKKPDAMDVGGLGTGKGGRYGRGKGKGKEKKGGFKGKDGKPKGKGK